MTTTNDFSISPTAQIFRNLAIACALLFGASTALAWEPGIACQDNHPGATEFDLPVTDSVSNLPDIAHGLFAAPDHAPTHLVVIGHGAGHTIESWRQHAEMLANDHGYLVVAMEYRDMIRRIDNSEYPSDKPKDLYHDYEEEQPELPRADGWPVRKGGEDLNAAARAFLNACPSIQTTVLTGISMGVAMTGWALTHDPKRENGRPLYDYWLAIEGVHNLTESYFEDRAANESRTSDGFTHTRFIEEEAGGGQQNADGSRKRVAYEDDQAPYNERTNLLVAEKIAANAGLARVIYVHGLYDGLVPYWQSRVMANLMNDVPFEFYTVTLRLRGDDGTVVEDHVLDPVNEGVEPVNIDPEAPLGGHAKESRGEHVVMRASFDRLADLVNNIDRQCGEYVSYDMVNPESPFSFETSQVVSEPVPGQTYNCETAPPRSSQPPSGGGKAKGSGWLQSGDNGKINFSFKIDSTRLADTNSDSDSDSDNRLKLRDKLADVKIRIENITAIGNVNGTCGSIESGPQALEFHGDGTYNGERASFRVCIADNGKGKEEPRDRFVLSCLQGCDYNTSARALEQLGGGNIRIHKSADAAENNHADSGNNAADAHEADVVFLGPMLDDKVLPGSTQQLEIVAVNGVGQRLANTAIELQLKPGNGATFSITAATGPDGIALIPVQMTTASVGIVATAGSVSSNWIELSVR